jgi:low temperature requirement protein LtrA
LKHAFKIIRVHHEDRRSSWLELFYDLIFVAAISQIVQIISQRSLSSLPFYLLLFVAVWWCWAGSTNFATRFSLPEKTTRFITGTEMIMVSVMTVFLSTSESTSGLVFVITYCAFRLLLIAKYGLVILQLPEIAPILSRLIGAFFLGILFWIVSLWVLPPWRYLLWTIGLFSDMAFIVSGRIVMAENTPNATHLPERFGLFTLIMLGEGVIGCLNTWVKLPFTGVIALQGLLCLLMAFAFWWLYFDQLNDVAIQRARSHKGVGLLHLWTFSHLLLAIGLCLSAAMIRYSITIGVPNTFQQAELFFSIFLVMLAIGAIHISSTCNIKTLTVSEWAPHALAPLLYLILTCSSLFLGLPVFPVTMQLLLITLLMIGDVILRGR